MIFAGVCKSLPAHGTSEPERKQKNAALGINSNTNGPGRQPISHAGFISSLLTNQVISLDGQFNEHLISGTSRIFKTETSHQANGENQHEPFNNICSHSFHFFLLQQKRFSSGVEKLLCDVSRVGTTKSQTPARARSAFPLRLAVTSNICMSSHFF